EACPPPCVNTTNELHTFGHWHGKNTSTRQIRFAPHAEPVLPLLGAWVCVLESHTGDGHVESYGIAAKAIDEIGKLGGWRLKQQRQCTKRHGNLWQQVISFEALLRAVVVRPPGPDPLRCSVGFGPVSVNQAALSASAAQTARPFNSIAPPVRYLDHIPLGETSDESLLRRRRRGPRRPHATARIPWRWRSPLLSRRRQ